MKRRILNGFIISLLIVFYVLFSNRTPSYSVMLDEPEEEVLGINYETVDEEDVWYFLSSAYNEAFEYKEEVVEEEILKQAEAVGIKKDDPSLVVKQNEAKKGVAKETTASQAVERYETNETSLGIDVSTWQGKINWKKVKESGITFAMIRCGYRGMESGLIDVDKYFDDNVKGAIANGINVGIYFFSMARNGAEALEEAEWVYNKIKNYDISYPVAIDIEIFNQYRLEGVSYSTMTDNALVFCNYMRSKGYTPMIYSYANALTKYFETSRFSNERIWLAQYNDVVTYKGKYYMWQYTSSGSVNGISGRVDMNVAYFSVTNDISKRSYATGVNNEGYLEERNFIPLEMDTHLTEDISLRTSPYTNLPNKAGSLVAGTPITVTGIGDEFIRFIYNDDVFYTTSLECYEVILKDIKFKSVDYTAVVNKEVELLKQPYIFLKDNVYRTLEVSEEINITGISEEFVRISIEDEDYYAKGFDFYDLNEEEESPNEEPEPVEPTPEPQPEEETEIEEETS